MKKIMSLVLALALVLSMGVTVFAAGNSGSTTVTDPTDTEHNSESIDVTAGYTAPSYTVEKTVYHVVVAWSQTGTITYTGDQFTYTWNPGEGDYGRYDQTGEAAHWTVNDAKVAITVTNKSNAAITATCAEPTEETGITVTGKYDDVSNGKLVLDSAAPSADKLPGTVDGTKQEATATYTITDVDGTITGAGTIATINVTITAGKN